MVVTDCNYGEMLAGECENIHILYITVEFGIYLKIIVMGIKC